MELNSILSHLFTGCKSNHLMKKRLPSQPPFYPCPSHYYMHFRETRHPHPGCTPSSGMTEPIPGEDGVYLCPGCAPSFPGQTPAYINYYISTRYKRTSNHRPIYAVTGHLLRQDKRGKCKKKDGAFPRRLRNHPCAFIIKKSYITVF